MDDATDIQFQIQWVGDMVSPPVPVNQSILVADAPGAGSSRSESHILALGFVSPPMIFPNMKSDDIAALAQQPLPVMSSGRFLISTSKLREIRDQITEHLTRTGDA